MLKPTGAAQLQASRRDQPSVLGRATSEQAPAGTAPAETAPEEHKAERKGSARACKPAAAPQGPAQSPGPMAQKPVMARTRRQTMAAAGHACGPVSRVSQADSMASRGSLLTSPAEDGLGRLVATQEIAPRARQTRRASVAPKLRGLAETVMAPQLPADRPKRRRGPRMATAPDQAAAAEEAEPQPPAKVARRQTRDPRMIAAPDQDAAQTGFAGAPPVLCSLEAINEDKEMEVYQEEEAGPSCTAAVGSAHQPSDAALATEGRTEQLHVHDACGAPAHGERGWGGQRVGAAEQNSKKAVIPTGCSDRELPERDSQQAPVLSKQHAPTGDSKQDKGSVRRSARQAVLAARPVSAQGQAACPRSALPVLDQAAAPAGNTAVCLSCSMHRPMAV